ncbi:hypothetical protein H4R21_001858 [Coemansia helicoidea]|uniref:Uncharacterized protein n=1 Tax=Coemansia helicoidea TaxID=1286919 RepID=A0ACC1LAR5_9FUNG|nr:hypothetical protein H4R21_001858 [Coemansia helicoidea]
MLGSPYLYKGVLAGVFDVRCGGIGSGLNNAAVFLAHSGVVDGKTNPFQRAFGFTAQNTWDVINQYVGKLWPAREDCTNVDEFKARVFSGLLVQCDGYRVGTVHRIFCPLAVMRFLARLRQVKTSEEVSFKGFRFWEETGRLTMIRSIKADSLVDLQRYLSHLTAAFHRQQEFQRNDPAMVQLESASSLDDNMIAQIASQPSEQNELAYGDDTEAQLVEICTAERVGVVDDLDVGEELTAATVMQLLYQAGYLVPVSDGRMAIPSEGVLSDLEAFYKKLKLVYNLRGNIGDYMARQMGVSDCDMGSFAASMRVSFGPLHELGEKTKESTYEMHVCQFLATFIPAGYMVFSQVKESTGISDTHMYTGPGATTDTPTCFIFEFKNYDGVALPKNAKRMTIAHRAWVAKRLWQRAKDSIEQIDDRYFKSATHNLAGFKRVLLFGMALWKNRFVMIVTQRRKHQVAKDDVSWPQEAFTRDDGVDDVGDIQGLDYADLGDDLSPDASDVRTFVRGGHFIAITI